MNVLAVAAHPGDIEFGCGGTLLSHRQRGDAITLLVMTTGEQALAGARDRIAEQEEAAALLGAALRWGDLEDGLVTEGRPTIAAVELALAESGAHVVYTHAPHDTHHDHRAVAVASLSALRRTPRVLCYEAPTSVDFDPTLYVDIEGLVEGKLDLLRTHMSQVMAGDLLDLEEVEARARYRGFAARVHHAEGFEVHRFVWDGATAPAEAGRAGGPGT